MALTENPDFGVLIGRFQMFHEGHLEITRRALKQTGSLLVLIGSANRARTPRNMFTYHERFNMLMDSIAEELGDDAMGRVEVKPLADRMYDNPGWIRQVQHILTEYSSPRIQPAIGLFGYDRDHTSSYLRDFPEWQNLCAVEQVAGGIAATTLREALFTGQDDVLRDHLPAASLRFVERFQGTEVFKALHEDRGANLAYKEKWGPGPHSTADAVVMRSGHILLIKRKFTPMKGSWALPGGFLEVHRNETLYETAVRELIEETNIAVDPTTLRGALRGQYQFDDPNRSERARIITTAFAFDLGNGYLPPITAGDDAAHAEWVPLSKIRADEMFDDHAFIISKMINIMAGT